MKSFTELTTWQEAHKLAIQIYGVTEHFPKSDTFGLAQQMQRSALSATSNIAEGFGRQTRADTIHFYVMARASLTELQNQIFLAKNTGKISFEIFNELITQSNTCIKLVGGLIRSTRKLTSS